MKVEKEETWSKSFVLTADDVKQIGKHFAHADKIVIKASCNDKVIREFASVADLIKFENAPSKEIKSLGINIYSGYRVIASIRFLNQKFYNIKTTLEDEESSVLKTIAYLEERCHAMEPWYSFMHKKLGLLLDIIVQFIFVTPASRFVINYSRSHVLSENLTLYLIYLATLIVLNMLVLWLWNKVKDYAFPPGVFAIGQGIKRHSERDNIRNTVIIGALISLITSLYITFAFG